MLRSESSRPPRALFRSMLLTSTCATLLASSGCGLLLGNVKPVEQKSESYRVMDLSQRDGDWVKLSAPEVKGESGDPEASTANGQNSDLAFQSKRTSNIISLNSACRASWNNIEKNAEKNADAGETNPQHKDQDLHEFSRLLTLGLSEVTERTEREVQVGGAPALETVVQGKISEETARLKTVVVRNKDCIYDLMYVAKPETFAEQEKTFGDFIQSLALKKD